MKHPHFSVVIPVYKNKEMVIRNLKHNQEFFKNCEVILVDDASGDGMTPDLQDLFPDMLVIENEENKGFGPTVNTGVLAAQAEYVILLGTDVRLTEPFAPSLIQRFEEQPDLFSLSFCQKERDGSSVGKNAIFFKRGLPTHSKTHDLSAGINAWADGGSSIVRKSMFHQLDGFNDIYAPFYWEDVDLSFRAYSRGWYVEFDPKLVVEHHHESTIGSLFSKKHVKTIAYRNQFLFTWSNITDRSLWMQHIMYLPYYLIRFALRGDGAFLKGFVMALSKMSRYSKDRERKIEHQVVSDADIFARFTE